MKLGLLGALNSGFCGNSIPTVCMVEWIPHSQALTRGGGKYN